MEFINTILCGSAIDQLKKLPNQSINCCVTSPPYYGLRDYGVDGQIGLEETPEEFIDKMVDIFREVKRVLKDDGTIWVNIGDSYAGSGKGQTKDGCADPKVTKTQGMKLPKNKERNLKPKDLIGIPWMLAFALRSDGWYLRQDIIWSKPNPMPESVQDRCTKSHEYIFLLSKSKKYYYDADSIKTKSKKSSIERLSRGISPDSKNVDGAPGQTAHSMNKPRLNQKRNPTPEDNKCGIPDEEMSNKRSVWEVTTKGYKEAHFATYPEKLIVDCIKAGCPDNGIVLDPFMGAGTTAVVAKKLGRAYVGIDLNPEYIKIAEKRIYHDIGLFN